MRNQLNLVHFMAPAFHYLFSWFPVCGPGYSVCGQPKKVRPSLRPSKIGESFFQFSKSSTLSRNPSLLNGPLQTKFPAIIKLNSPFNHWSRNPDTILAAKWIIFFPKTISARKVVTAEIFRSCWCFVSVPFPITII